MGEVLGQCSICGVLGAMSFEHVPPSAAFNNTRILSIPGKDLFNRPGLVDPDAGEGEQEQRGAGGFTLCARCNNTTGRYGRAYVEYAKQAAELVVASRGAIELACQFKVYPLRVIKQVVCMFMSACGPGLRQRIPYLERFVMSKTQTGLPPSVGIFAGYTVGSFSRTAGVTGMLADGIAHTFSEIAFRPFVFVLTLEGTPPPDRRLTEITWFAKFQYNDLRYIYPRMSLLDVRSQFPGDYRPEAEILRAVATQSASGSA